MQSIKNTSVAIMLLFLSYSVYQIIMKPTPSEDMVTQTESLEILDPGDMVGDALPDLREDFFPDATAGVEETQPIPPELLEATPPAPGQVNASASDVDTTSNSPLASAWNDSDNLRAGGSPAPPPTGAFRSSQPGDSLPEAPANGFERRASSQTPAKIDSHLESDLQVMPPALADATSVNTGTAAAEPVSSPAPAGQVTPASLAQSWPQIKAAVESGAYQQALRTLTQFYRSPSLSDQERQQVLDWLDALAAKVIYSSEHHLRSIPYIIQPGDTIASLARQWKIPAQLIYNVNTSKIPDPNELTPGVELKLIEGPFDAELDPQGDTMTLFLDDMYAGRFQIQSSPGILPGEYVIVDKSAQDHIDRPFCIKLNNGVCIYANSATPAPSDEVVLSPVEAEEIFSILSAASKIRVLR